MMIPTLLVQRPEWQALQAHLQRLEPQTMRDWFAEDPRRFEDFSLRCGGLLFDYSKNRVRTETIDLLVQLAQSLDLPAQIQALFSAEPLNLTEARPALHMALRDSSRSPLWVNQQDVRLLVQAALAQMNTFVQAVRSQTWRGATGQPVSEVVNLGIGGSHLGPLMATEALSGQADQSLRFHFISDVD